MKYRIYTVSKNGQKVIVLDRKKRHLSKPMLRELERIKSYKTPNYTANDFMQALNEIH